VKVDALGIPLPDEPAPQRRGPEWWCLMCGRATWPTVTADGTLTARLCQPCQCLVDDAKAEHARTRRDTR